MNLVFFFLGLGRLDYVLLNGVFRNCEAKFFHQHLHHFIGAVSDDQERPFIVWSLLQIHNDQLATVFEMAQRKLVGRLDSHRSAKNKGQVLLTGLRVGLFELLFGQVLA